MVGNIKACGRMENNMVKENFIILKIKYGKKEYGMMERDLSGILIPIRRVK
jgi:hypothetical protein